MENIRCVIWISIIACACTFVPVSCHNDNEAPSAKYKRDPYALLARFASDELSIHSRKRRQLVESVLDITYQIEDLSITYLYQDFTTPDPAQIQYIESYYAVLTTEYCFYNRLNDDVSYALNPNGCISGKYRKFDGECNNIGNPRWGSSDYPFRRLLDAVYTDKIYTPAPVSVSARAVSLAFVGHDEIYDEYGASELVMHMGQFIDHDLALTPHLEADCGCDETRECLPITCEDEDDPVCQKYGCVKFARSRPVIEVQFACDVTSVGTHCRTHPNAITSFLDASNVYGSYEVTASELRTHEGGLLSLQEDPNDEGHIHLLPNDEENKECSHNNDKFCGKGGDIRAAEQPVLTSLHTLFANQHNRIAKELGTLHGCWDDEALFQESRRINTALMQKIVYGEWLPLVIGQKAMEKYNLGLWQNYVGYDETVNPTIFNEFASAFFRFGHSMAPEFLKRVDPTWADVHDDIALKESFFNASVCHDLGNGGVNSLILGTLDQPLLAIDRHHSRSIHKHLFENFEDFGLDLVALNIQRGRDHGLPGYIKYREYCGFGTVTSFEDLDAVMDEKAWAALKDVYDSVEEVEPFVGMLAEKHMQGALVGETLACILGTQFQNLKYGDRFWFENDFTAEQLAAIKKVTMSRVICENVFVEKIQPAAFKLQSEEASESDVHFYEMINTEAYPDEAGRLNKFVNNRVSCDNVDAIPKLDLSAWEDEIPKSV